MLANLAEEESKSKAYESESVSQSSEDEDASKVFNLKERLKQKKKLER